ncbi:Aldo-keto reductase family 1 member A1 [Lamellibrachia satsuma]|nr:Aldo-keto reductase family 1 member A1 [Lamellibrachia satsuma]
MDFVNLNTGSTMPLVGLGTFKVRGHQLISEVIDAALDAGYRAIDTAEVYQNEVDISSVLETFLPKYNLQRNEIFLTSKLGPKSQGREACRKACEQSLHNLKVDSLDLYLIHWPGTQGRKPENPQNAILRKETWLELEDLQKEGKLRAIGVSNYTAGHLRELLSYCSVRPAVLQVECHPYLVQRELLNLCRDEGLLEDTTVKQIADKYQRSPSQILLRWATQQNIGVIPRSTKPSPHP